MPNNAEPRMERDSKYDQTTGELKTARKAKKEAAAVADAKGLKNTEYRRKLAASSRAHGDHLKP